MPATPRRSSASGILGIDPQSLPTAHGFDEFYGIPPDISWDSATYVDTIELTHSDDAPPDVLLAKGPQIYEAVAGGPLRKVKPYTREVRAEIDNELVAKSIDFMKRQKAAGKPFFLYLPFSMGHFPNLPSKQFAGKSRIGQYGDKIMEGDYHVGQILDALKELEIDDNTLLVFASDNGPARPDRPRDGQPGHTGHGQLRSLPRRAGRSHRGIDQDLLLRPLAGQDQAGHQLLRDVLDHGLPSDLRHPHRQQAAD